ncbi:hypothetical protein Dimus_010404 [Dionaea muscipula]
MMETADNTVTDLNLGWWWTRWRGSAIGGGWALKSRLRGSRRLWVEVDSEAGGGTAPIGGGSGQAWPDLSWSMEMTLVTSSLLLGGSSVLCWWQAARASAAPPPLHVVEWPSGLEAAAGLMAENEGGDRFGLAAN